MSATQEGVPRPEAMLQELYNARKHKYELILYIQMQLCSVETLDHRLVCVVSPLYLVPAGNNDDYVFVEYIYTYVHVYFCVCDVVML